MGVAALAGDICHVLLVEMWLDPRHKAENDVERV